MLRINSTSLSISIDILMTHFGLFYDTFSILYVLSDAQFPIHQWWWDWHSIFVDSSPVHVNLCDTHSSSFLRLSSSYHTSCDLSFISTIRIYVRIMLHACYLMTYPHMLHALLRFHYDDCAPWSLTIRPACYQSIRVLCVSLSMQRYYANSLSDPNVHSSSAGMCWSFIQMDEHVFNRRG